MKRRKIFPIIMIILTSLVLFNPSAVAQMKIKGENRKEIIKEFQETLKKIGTDNPVYYQYQYSSDFTNENFLKRCSKKITEPLTPDDVRKQARKFKDFTKKEELLNEYEKQDAKWLHLWRLSNILFYFSEKEQLENVKEILPLAEKIIESEKNNKERFVDYRKFVGRGNLKHLFRRDRFTINGIMICFYQNNKPKFILVVSPSNDKMSEILPYQSISLIKLDYDGKGLIDDFVPILIKTDDKINDEIKKIWNNKNIGVYLPEWDYDGFFVSVGIRKKTYSIDDYIIYKTHLKLLQTKGSLQFSEESEIRKQLLIDYEKSGKTDKDIKKKLDEWEQDDKRDKQKISDLETKLNTLQEIRKKEKGSALSLNEVNIR